MKPRTGRRLLPAALAAGLCAAPAWAQGLADPMRPPAEYLPKEAQPQAATSGQIVVISRDRKFAVINGQTVALGGYYQGSRVVDITDDTVVLKGNGAAQTKTMRLQDSGKRMRAPAAATGGVKEP
jgi:MSHA biogenesis protein MshK